MDVLIYIIHNVINLVFKQDSATHSKQLNLTNATLEWIPPTDVSGLGNISFYATVVKDKTNFWVMLKSPELMVSTLTKLEKIYKFKTGGISVWFITMN